jgi:multidrug efflux pump subunit AcrB
MEYSTIYNPTEFISQSIDAVYHTLFEAVVLVVLVILVFLQNWRAAIIPIIAIPVSLIGTALMLAGLGYSLNNLSLFGLVLAIGIVVDDAIVVVENVERNIALGQSRSKKRGHRWTRFRPRLSRSCWCSARCSCRRYSSPASRSVLSPVRGDDLDGDRHLARPQLTLSPAMAARLLRHGGPSVANDLSVPRWRRMIARAGDRFNTGFDRLSDGYAALTRRLLAAPRKVIGVYAALIAATIALFVATPSGFIPAQDQGYFLAIVQLPPGASLERTDAVTREVAARILPIQGLRGAVMFAGSTVLRRRRLPIRQRSISRSSRSMSGASWASPIRASWIRRTRR